MSRSPELSRRKRPGAIGGAIGGAILLTACATHPGPERVVYQEVAKPVAVSCVPKDAPAAPKVHTPEELRQVPGGPDRYVLIAADYLKLFAWQLTAAPVLDGCKAAAP